jgi:phage repressor protein C with HTH and peptisase S24 domain
MREIDNFSYQKSSPNLIGTADNSRFNFGTMEMPENIGESIAAERKRRGLSQHDLAKAVRLSQPAIKKIEDGTTRQSKHLWQIMAYLGLEMPKITAHEKNEASIIPASRLVMPGQDFPVYASAEGGPGELNRSPEPIDWIPRPVEVANVKDAYGLIVVGSSMEDEFEPGDTAIVNPNLPIIFNKTYIFYAEIEGAARATIKRLVRSSSEAWTVKQRNPEKQFQLKKNEWGIAHRVIGKRYG